MKRYSVAIIGAGPAGLFAASALKKKNNSFVIIDTSRESVGGLALYGGIKIGLLPAGERTASIVGKKEYQLLSQKFILKYKKYFSQLLENRILNFPQNLQNKYYNSYILEGNILEILKKKSLSTLSNYFLYHTVVKIDKTNNATYHLVFNNGEEIYCDKLIVASGRSKEVNNLLGNIGQKYHEDKKCLVGCRATFESSNSAKIFEHQHDFKLKAHTGFQNYCFNHRGYLHKLSYCGYNYYSGSLDLNSKTGNTFVGKKILINNNDIYKYLESNLVINYSDLKHADFFKSDKNYKDDLIAFLKYFENDYNVLFHKLFFPALEQFWPAPRINYQTFESEYLPKVFFIGDASGVSFGVLQCYITANHVVNEIT